MRIYSQITIYKFIKTDFKILYKYNIIRISGKDKNEEQTIKKLSVINTE